MNLAQLVASVMASAAINEFMEAAGSWFCPRMGYTAKIPVMDGITHDKPMKPHIFFGGTPFSDVFRQTNEIPILDDFATFYH